MRVLWGDDCIQDGCVWEEGVRVGCFNIATTLTHIHLSNTYTNTHHHTTTPTSTPRYDRTVRDEVGAVVQFLYGEDGMDATLIESQTLDHLRMNPDQIAHTYKFDMAGTKPAWMHPSAYLELQDPEVREMADAEFEVGGVGGDEGVRGGGG